MTAKTIPVGNSSRTASKLFHDVTDVNDRAVAYFVGPNSDYYLDRWQKIRYGKAIFSWNWAAFLVPLYWLAYRKMYAYSAILGTLIVWRIYVKTGFDVPMFFSFVKYLDCIVIGMIGNFLYYHHARKSIAEIELKRQESEPLESLEETLGRVGGVSKSAVFAIVACYVVCVIILVTLVSL